MSSVDSDVVGPVQSSGKPIKDFTTAHVGSTYTITGHNIDGTAISWHGTSHQNFMKTINDFAGRMA